MKLLVAVSFILLLGACSSTPVEMKPADTMPHWVLAPERPGYISVVGYAPKQPVGGQEAQYRVAVMKARQELAQIVNVRVQNTLSQSVKESGGKVNSDASSVTTLRSKAALRLGQAEVTAQWRDPADDGLYLLVEIAESESK
jgi:LPP20 lipoprotein